MHEHGRKVLRQREQRRHEKEFLKEHGLLRIAAFYWWHDSVKVYACPIHAHA